MRDSLGSADGHGVPGARVAPAGPRGVRLTADGERLLSVVAPHLDALDHALRPYSPRRDDVLTLELGRGGGQAIRFVPL